MQLAGARLGIVIVIGTTQRVDQLLPIPVCCGPVDSVELRLLSSDKGDLPRVIDFFCTDRGIFISIICAYDMEKTIIQIQVLANGYSQHYDFSIPWKLSRPDTNTTLQQLRHLLLRTSCLEYDSRLRTVHVRIIVHTILYGLRTFQAVVAWWLRALVRSSDSLRPCHLLLPFLEFWLAYMNMNILFGHLRSLLSVWVTVPLTDSHNAIECFLYFIILVPERRRCVHSTLS